MYISSGFLNKNAHKFFNGNVEKNDFFGINRVRFMQTQSFGGVTPFVYTPTGKQKQEDNKGITDTITTVIRSPADLQALTKGGNAYLPPDVYAALARGEEVAVTLNQRPPERVNLLVPVFAAFAQMAGSSGAAYNKELGEAIQGKGAGSGTGLGAAADFVNRYGGDYDLNPFGGASHIDIDAQYKILSKKDDPKKEKVPPLEIPQINLPTKKKSHFTPEEKETLQREQPELFALTNGTVHFDTKDPKIQNEINTILKKNPPNINDMKLLLENFSFSENVLSPAQKTLLENQVKNLQTELGLPEGIFNSKTGAVDVDKVNNFIKDHPDKAGIINDFVDVAVDTHEVSVKTQANSKTDSTKSNTNAQQTRKQEYHTIVGGDEYLVPFAKDLIKQGIDISSLRTNGEIDQKKVLELVNYLNDPKSTPKPSQDIINKIGSNNEIKGSAKQIKADFTKYGLGMTEEEQAKKFIKSHTGSEPIPTDISMQSDNSNYASSFVIAPKLPNNPTREQRLEYAKLVIYSVKGMTSEDIDKVVGTKGNWGDAKSIDGLSDKQLKKLCSEAGKSLEKTGQMSKPAKEAVTGYLQTAVKTGVVTLKDEKGNVLPKDKALEVIEKSKNNPVALRNFFKQAETELRAGGTGSDGFLGAHHITALQMAIINKAQDMSQLSSLALKSYEGKPLSTQEEKKLGSLLKEYNKNHEPNISLKSPISKETIVNLLNQTKGELQSLQSNVLKSPYGSGESAHPELKQMCDEIGKFISGAPEGNGKKMGINSAIEKISKESTIPDSHVTLKNELADLTNASAAIAKISSGDMPLTEPFKIGLDKVIEQYNKENPNVTVSVDTDKLSKDDSLKLLGFIETKMEKVLDSSKKSGFDDVATKVEAKLNKDNDTSIDGIRKIINNDPNTAYFNQLKTQTDSIINSKSESVDTEGLKALETTFIEMLKDPTLQQKPEYREIISGIAQNFATLNAQYGSISNEIKDTLKGILDSNAILDKTPKPAIVTKPTRNIPAGETHVPKAEFTPAIKLQAVVSERTTKPAAQEVYEDSASVPQEQKHNYAYDIRMARIEEQKKQKEERESLKNN